MARHLNFRNDCDVPLRAEGDDLTDIAFGNSSHRAGRTPIERPKLEKGRMEASSVSFGNALISMRQP